jgi:hypothetical protein
MHYSPFILILYRKIKKIEADENNNLDGMKDYQLIDHLVNKNYASDDSDDKRRDKKRFVDEHRKRDSKTNFKYKDGMNDEIDSDNAGGGSSHMRKNRERDFDSGSGVKRSSNRGGSRGGRGGRGGSRGGNRGGRGGRRGGRGR